MIYYTTCNTRYCIRRNRYSVQYYTLRPKMGLYWPKIRKMTHPQKTPVSLYPKVLGGAGLTCGSPQ